MGFVSAIVLFLHALLGRRAALLVSLGPGGGRTPPLQSGQLL